MSPETTSLEGRVMLVTGGGSGLGAAICRELAGYGAAVVVTDVDLDRARATAETIEQGRASVQRLDVRDANAVERTLADVAHSYGRLDAVVNNAGIDATKSVLDLTVEEWTEVMSVNLHGPFLVSKAAFAHMRDGRRGGHIINITSTAARRAWANASAYHASKWGLLGLSHALHVEGRPLGIKVTAVIAGGMRTPFLLDRFPDIDRSVLQDPDHVAHAVRFALTQPAGTVIPELTVVPEQETSWP